MKFLLWDEKGQLIYENSSCSLHPYSVLTLLHYLIENFSIESRDLM